MPGASTLKPGRAAGGRAKKKAPGIRAVLFDMGNVLVLFDARIAARRFAVACGLPVSRVWIHFFTSSVEKSFTCGRISPYAFYREAREALGFSLSYAVFREYWNGIFRENEGMEELVQALKRQYPLYVISNTNKLHWDFLKKHYRILRHFRRTFPSHEVGFSKPDKRIYEKVLKSIRRKPEETVFIDDVAVFVAGARKAGMQAIRFRNPKQLARELRKLGIQFQGRESFREDGCDQSD